MLGSSFTLVQSQWKCYLKPQRTFRSVSLLFRLGGTAAWWFCHLVTLEITSAGMVLDGPIFECVCPPSSKRDPYLSYIKCRKITHKQPFVSNPGVSFSPSSVPRATSTNFCKYPLYQRCTRKHVIFLGNWRAVRITSAEEWKFTLWPSPKWGFWQKDIWERLAFTDCNHIQRIFHFIWQSIWVTHPASQAFLKFKHRESRISRFQNINMADQL